MIATDDPEMTSPVDRGSLTVTVTEADYPEMERSQHGSMVSADISERVSPVVSIASADVLDARLTSVDQV